MATSRLSSFTFTKLVVDDLDKAAFYGQVYELEQITRMRDAIGPAAIEEIILGTARPLTPGALILLRYVDKPRPHNGEVISASPRAICRHCSTACAPWVAVCTPDIRDFPDMKVRVAFATDPEGQPIEIVEWSD